MNGRGLAEEGTPLIFFGSWFARVRFVDHKLLMPATKSVRDLAPSDDYHGISLVYQIYRNRPVCKFPLTSCGWNSTGTCCRKESSPEQGGWWGKRLTEEKCRNSVTFMEMNMFPDDSDLHSRAGTKNLLSSSCFIRLCSAAKDVEHVERCVIPLLSEIHIDSWFICFNHLTRWCDWRSLPESKSIANGLCLDSLGHLGRHGHFNVLHFWGSWGLGEDTALQDHDSKRFCKSNTKLNSHALRHPLA